MLKKFISFVGFKRSGKDTASEIFADYWNSLPLEQTRLFEGVKMADALKLAICEAFDFTMNEANGIGYDREKDFEVPIILTEKNLSVFLDTFFDGECLKLVTEVIVNRHSGLSINNLRHLLQYFGTEIMRTIDDNIHAKATCRKAMWSDGGIINCTDIRFIDEYNYCKEYSSKMEYEYVTIYVCDPDTEEVTIKEIVETPEKVHPSEREIPLIKSMANHIITNDKSLGMDHFKNTLTEIFKTL